MAASTYPAEFFRDRKIEHRTGYCFVLMPFAQQLQEVFETVKECIESPPWNFECRRADDFFAGGHILRDILQGIAEAEVVVADLTDRNPNVFYELGIAHMIKQPEAVVLLTQNMESVPFDLQAFRCIVYTQNIQGARKLKLDLTNAFQEITVPVYRFSIKQRSSYEFPHRLFGESRCLYDFTLFADYLGTNAVKFTLQVRQYVAGEPDARVVNSNGYGIGVGESRRIPYVPWEVRLDQSDEQSAAFSIIRSPDPHT